MNTVKLRFNGIANWSVRFLEEHQLNNPAQWRKFVNVYRSQPDSENAGWRGEYWGKMMLGGALIFAYSNSQMLYDVLTETVEDMLTVAEDDGRVSTYKHCAELDAWDLWCRKYVLLAWNIILKSAVMKG